MSRTPDGSPGRRRTAIAVLVAAALVLGAGCTGTIGGGGSGGGGAAPATDVVPADVDAIAYLDVQDAVGDETLRDVANEYLSLQAQNSFGDPPSSVSEVLSQAENSTTLEVDGLRSVTMYTRTTDGDDLESSVDDEYAGFVIQTDWSESDLVAAIENDSDTDLEAGTYAGATLYESDEDDSYLGVLDDGRFVAGSESAVEDALDVAAGNADAVSGPVATAFEDTRDGYVRYAGAVAEDQVPTEELDQTGAVSNANIFTDVSVVSGAQYVSDDAVGMELTMTVDDSGTAKDLRDVTRGGLAWVRNTLNGTPTGDRFGGLLDRESLSVEQSGSDVTVTSENGAAELTSLLRTLYGSESL